MTLSTLAREPTQRYWTSLEIAVAIFAVVAMVSAGLRLWLGYN